MINKINKKIIIWGHKFGTDTYSYVQNAFHRTFQYLGYETYWFDDNDDVSNFDFSNSIFITEHRVRNNMPVLKDCIYFDHFSDDQFEYAKRPDHENYYNFIIFWQDHNWPSSSELIEVSPKHFFHSKTKTMSVIWGTDLLPTEIDSLEPKLYDENLNDIYFIGTPQGENISNFEKICNFNGKRFSKVGGWAGVDYKSPVTVEYNIELVRNSYLSFDIRESHYLKKYYPCRIFKNISYGKWTGSNVPDLSDIFGEYYTAESNLESLYYKLVEDSKNCTYEKMKNAMNFIRDNHTYVNRIKSLFSVLD